MQTIHFVALSLIPVQLSVSSLEWAPQGRCFTLTDVCRESSTLESRFRMPNIWKPFIFMFISQDLSSRPCVYGWPVLTLPVSANSAVKTWLCSRKQLLASSPLNPEASSAVWPGHQALWFNYDYQLHSSLLELQALPPQVRKNAKDMQWCEHPCMVIPMYCTMLR